MKLRIRREADGAVREIDAEMPSDWDEDGDFIWTEGNYACDCNRFLFFERAGGREPGDDEGPCGHTGYTLLLPDGTES